MAKQFKENSNKIWLAVFVLAIPLLLIFFSGKQPVDLQVPDMAQQPTDTVVANQFLPLHYWQTKAEVPVYFVPTDNLPIFDMIISFDAGSARDGKRPGISKTLVSLLDEGTENYTASQLAERFDDLAMQYSAQVGRDRAIIKIRSLTEPKKLKAAVELLAEILAKPSVSEEAFARIKQQLLVQIGQGEQDPGTVVHNTFLQTVYGDHPYAHSPLGTSASIEALQRDEVLQFHQQHYNCDNAHITIVGGVHRDTAKQLAELVLSKLNKGEKLPKLPAVADLEKPVEKRVPFPSTQAHIVLGQLGRIAGDPDMFPITVGNYVLGGGGFTTRLMQEVRVKNGLSYDARSQWWGLKERGPFFMAAQTRTEEVEKALKIMRETLNDFVEKGPSDEELTLAKQYLQGSFPLNFNSNAKIAAGVSEASYYQLPHDFFDKYRQKIDTVTKEQIVETFKRRVKPDDLATVVVGEQLG